MYIRNPFRPQQLSLVSVDTLIPYGEFSRDYAVDRIVKMTGLERQRASYLFNDALKSGDIISLGIKGS